MSHPARRPITTDRDRKAAAAASALARVTASDVAASSWTGSAFQELADKIERQHVSFLSGGLAEWEKPVTNADRNLLTRTLPRGIVVQKNDPAG